jgi:NAD(P)-dependent dehydrogenase (short-subunit alcohol dehydrogenase family)
MMLKDRVAIVTGGANGIGREISYAFAREGAIPVVADIDLAAMKSAVLEIESMGGRADSVETDLRREDRIKAMTAYVVEKFGRLDILVNNAAISGARADVAEMDLEAWNETFAVNLTAPMLCAREALKPMMAAGRGVIINVASEGGRSGFPGRSPYSVSKRGVIALTETLAIEVGKYGIRVNAISPGRVITNLLKNSIRLMAESRAVSEDEVMKGLIADCSLQRFVEASEVAGAAVFLASDGSSAVTGHTLVVSCGKHIMH